jgi:hypothetical protein
MKLSTPAWIDEIQRTIIPRSQLTQVQRPGSMGAQSPQMAPGSMSSKQPDQRDTVPAMLREGEEVITPETKQAMGGREAMMEALNSKLAPKGLALKATRPPVTNTPFEQQMWQGTMDVQGYAGGTAAAAPAGAGAPSTGTPAAPSVGAPMSSPLTSPFNAQIRSGAASAPDDYKRRTGYARGTQQMMQPQPTYYPGGIFTQMNSNSL